MTPKREKAYNRAVSSEDIKLREDSEPKEGEGFDDQYVPYEDEDEPYDMLYGSEELYQEEGADAEETYGDEELLDEDGKPAPWVLDRPDHSVSRKRISASAVKVLYRLHRSGYKAFLVGGGVRDLMLNRRPKDFDIATDAQPNEIRRLFRNARIIGRRFRLAHIIFHDGVVEVATFRRTPDPNEQRGSPGELLITSDNTFGTPREDAFRRDFTINALFYNIGDFTVVDYVGGIEDLENKLVRVIGDPDVRFCEDPVRMMRACEFAGRLNFTIERGTQEGIERNRKELRKGAPPRLTEELLQLLKSGHAGASVQWMLELGLLDVLLPEARAMLRAVEVGAGEFGNILPVLDKLAAEGRQLPDAVLFAAVLLPQIMLERFERETKTQRYLAPAQFRKVVLDTVGPFFARFAIPNMKKAHMNQALEGFHRLCEGGFTRAQKARFAKKSYFDDSLALFELLVLATGEGHEELDQWQISQRQRKRRDPRPETRHDTRRGRPRRRRR